MSWSLKQWDSPRLGTFSSHRLKPEPTVQGVTVSAQTPSCVSSVAQESFGRRPWKWPRTAATRPCLKTQDAARLIPHSGGPAGVDAADTSGRIINGQAKQHPGCQGWESGEHSPREAAMRQFRTLSVPFAYGTQIRSKVKWLGILIRHLQSMRREA